MAQSTSAAEQDNDRLGETESKESTQHTWELSRDLHETRI